MPNIPVLNSYCPLIPDHPLNKGLISEWSTLAQPHGRTGYPSRILFNLVTWTGTPYNGTLGSAQKWGGQQNRCSGQSSLVMTGVANEGVDTGSRAGPPGGFTCAGWARPATVGIVQIFTASWSSTLTYHQFFFNGAAIVGRIFDSAGNWLGRGSTNVFVANSWQHLAFTWDGSLTSAGVRLYRNGIRIDSSNDNSGTVTGPSTDLANWLIGKQNFAANYYNGLIGDISIYNRGLSPGEVVALYQESLAGNQTRYNWLKSGWYGTSPPPPPSTAGNLLLLGVGW